MITHHPLRTIFEGDLLDNGGEDITNEERRVLSMEAFPKAAISSCLFPPEPNGLRQKLKLRFRVGDLNLPERRKRYTSRREEEDVATNMCPCGTTIQSRTHIVGECEICKEERDASEEETRKLHACDMEELGRLESGEKTIAILGGRWWPQTGKQDGDRISKQFLRNLWKKRNERPNVGGVSIRSMNGAPSQKGCVVNGHMTKASNK